MPESYYIGVSGVAHTESDCAPMQHYVIQSDNLLPGTKFCQNCTKSPEIMSKLRALEERIVALEEKWNGGE